jgi:methanogenic corrinoid protein MtbC1
MNLFSISQLAQYSGIKPHTIRIWEQRYNALKPVRSEGNTRYYDNQQLRRLLNIVSLIDTDHKVSELCSMSDEALYRLIKLPDQEAGIFEYYVSQMIAAGMSYNEDYFEELFVQCVNKYQIKETYKRVIYPLLQRVGLMWSGNRIPSAQEHFISNIIRRKLLRSIDLLPAAEKSGDKWVLFLPENEFHEIGLLFADYIIKESGRKVVYLGSSVATESISTIIRDLHPAYLLLFMVHYDLPENAQQYLDNLTREFKGKKICVAGNYKLLRQVKVSEKIYWLQSIEALEKMFEPILN